MNRRAFMAAAPALALAGAVPATAAPTADMVSLWREVVAIKARLNRPGADLDSPEWEADYDRLIVLQDNIAAAEARSAQDMAVKILNADDSGMFNNCNVWADALLSKAKALTAA